MLIDIISAVLLLLVYAKIKKIENAASEIFDVSKCIHCKSEKFSIDRGEFWIKILCSNCKKSYQIHLRDPRR